MKQPKEGGRLLADIGEDLKKRFYRILFEKNLTYKDWLKKTVSKYVEREREDRK